MSLVPGVHMTPLRVSAAYEPGRRPATLARRIGASLIDWFLLLPVAVVLGLVHAALDRAGLAGPFAAALLFSIVLTLHWLHALVFDGGSGAGTAGKRLVGLLVIDGATGEALGAGPAVVRRVLGDLSVFGAFAAALVLTSWRQHGLFALFPTVPYVAADYGVLVLWLSVFLAPVVGYRVVAAARQWVHDRAVGAVVVRLMPQPPSLEARPVPPLPYGAGGAGAGAGADLPAVPAYAVRPVAQAVRDGFLATAAAATRSAAPRAVPIGRAAPMPLVSSLARGASRRTVPGPGPDSDAGDDPAVPTRPDPAPRTMERLPASPAVADAVDEADVSDEAPVVDSPRRGSEVTPPPLPGS